MKGRNILDVLAPLPKKLQNIFGDSLKAVILFGSYARGTEDAESDVDIAVILDGTNTDMNSFEQSLSDITAEFTLENQCLWLFSLIPIRLSVYVKWKDTLPFYKNIEKEGIPLYIAPTVQGLICSNN